MTSVANPIPPQDFSGIVGHRFIYTYANGWQYEMYVKNATTIDYRIHSGHVGGRWVKGQEVNLVQLDDDSFKISWTEPTGTCVAVNVLPSSGASTASSSSPVDPRARRAHCLLPERTPG